MNIGKEFILILLDEHLVQLQIMKKIWSHQLLIPIKMIGMVDYIAIKLSSQQKMFELTCYKSK